MEGFQVITFLCKLFLLDFLVNLIFIVIAKELLSPMGSSKMPDLLSGSEPKVLPGFLGDLPWSRSRWDGVSNIVDPKALRSSSLVKLLVMLQVILVVANGVSSVAAAISPSMVVIVVMLFLSDWSCASLVEVALSTVCSWYSS